MDKQRYEDTLNQKELGLILLELKKSSGIDFSDYKQSTLTRRIERRMASNQIAHPQDYVSYLSDCDDEKRALRKEILISVTNFFRDGEPFRQFYSKLLPKLSYEKGMIRGWCAACSTGEEAYSVAILMMEYLEQNQIECDFKLYASDLNAEAIYTAEAGRYSETKLRWIPEDIRNKYFEKAGNGYHVRDFLRRHVVFCCQNILTDPLNSNLDFIVCRNFLIYIRPEVQQRLLILFHQLMHGKGHLFLGSSEAVSAAAEAYTELDIKNKLYSCNPAYSIDMQDQSPVYSSVQNRQILVDSQEAKSAEEKNERIELLRDALIMTDSSLKRTRAELERSNEELQASCEEVMAMNQELQSSYEDLQMANSRLNLVNSEFHQKIVQLQELTDDLDNLLVNGEIGALYLDDERKIRKITPLMMTFCGLTEKDVGEPVSKINFPQSYTTFAQDVMEAEQNGVVLEREVHDDAGSIWLMRFRPYFTLSRYANGVLVTLFDITKRLQAAKFELRQLINSIPGGVLQFTVNVDQLTITFASDGFYQLVGYTREEYLNLKKSGRGLALVPPEDQEDLLKKVTAGISGDGTLSLECRFLRKGGGIIWVAARGSAMEHSNGLTSAQFVVADITDLKLMQETLQNQRDSMEIVASLFADALFEYDLAGDVLSSTICDANACQGQRIEHYSEKLLANGQLYTKDSQAAENFIHDLKSGKETVSAEFRIKQENGRFGWIRMEGKTLYHKDGVPYKVLGKIINIEEQKQQDQLLQMRMQQDSMTGLFHKAEFKNRVSALLKDFNQKDSIAALAVLDVDDFKEINASLGHVFGDEVLIHIAGNLEKQFAAAGVVGRVGGDGFAVYFANLGSQQELEAQVNAIRELVQNTYVGETSLKQITVSIGVSVCPDNGKTLESLLEHANRALYAAKQNGKNRCEYYSESRYGNDPGYKSDEPDSDQPTHSNEEWFNYEITDFALDLMTNTKDVTSAINLLLQKVGNYFKLSRVVVKEKNQESCCFVTTYEWYQKGLEPALGSAVGMTGEQWKALEDQYINKGFLFSSEMGAQTPEEVTEELKRLKTHSHIHYAIHDSGSIVGSIGFQDIAENRCWKPEELRVLKTIGKILSSYLLKMRAFEEARRQVEILSSYDTITGLLKHEVFIKRVESTLKQAAPGQRFALVYSDIGNFKFINENYGYSAGDGVLKAFAQKICFDNPRCVFACRVFSDNFIGMMDLPVGMTNTELAAEINNARREFVREQQELYPDSNLVVVSGACEIDGSLEDRVSAATDNANSARKAVKAGSGWGCMVFDETMAARLRKDGEMIASFNSGLKNKEFYFVLQPKVNLLDSHIVGAEALVRWRKLDGTVIYPNDFIPLFEKNGFITRLDFYIYEEVFRYLSGRLKAGKKVVPISVNVSRIHLKNNHFIDGIKELVDRYEIPAHLLEFELTESVFMENTGRAEQVMDSLRDMGYQVSIDDFGSGYSSLNLLRNLSLDVLKLDKGFLSNENFSSKDKIVILSAIEMTKRMHITVLCEGVENSQQVQFLKDAGCDLVQGYFFARPMEVSRFDEMLEKGGCLPEVQ